MDPSKNHNIYLNDEDSPLMPCALGLAPSLNLSGKIPRAVLNGNVCSLSFYRDSPGIYLHCRIYEQSQRFDSASRNHA